MGHLKNESESARDVRGSASDRGVRGASVRGDRGANDRGVRGANVRGDHDARGRDDHDHDVHVHLHDRVYDLLRKCPRERTSRTKHRPRSERVSLHFSSSYPSVKEWLSCLALSPA